MIDKSPSAAKGLLLVSIGEENLGTINSFSLNQAITTTLKSKLETLNLTNANEITDNLSREIVKNQSLFFIISI